MEHCTYGCAALYGLQLLWVVLMKPRSPSMDAEEALPEVEKKAAAEDENKEKAAGGEHGEEKKEEEKGGGADGDEKPFVLPMPPFSDSTPYGGGNVVECFWPDCSMKRRSYVSLMSHMKQEHVQNKVPKEWKGTYFGKKARAEENDKQNARRTKKPPAPADGEPAAGGPNVRKRQTPPAGNGPVPGKKTKGDADSDVDSQSTDRHDPRDLAPSTPWHTCAENVGSINKSAGSDTQLIRMPGTSSNTMLCLVPKQVLMFKLNL